MAWKVGQLSERTGLTVRTLHHYDQIGLLRPSARTSSGHRLYDERDVQRLYTVVVLRELGVPLESIGALLDDGRDLTTVLNDHLSQVDRQLAALRDVRTKLAGLVRAAGAHETVTPHDLLDMIDEVSTMEKTFNNYFTDQQQADLERHHENVGKDKINETIVEWPRLIAAVQAKIDAGVDPGDPEVQRLAGRWMELLELFHGGDPGLRDSYYRMREENSAEVEKGGGPSDAMVDYIKRANEARS